jgi:hypothetical protein
MIKLIDILKETEEIKISEYSFNSKAKSFFDKLSPEDVMALRSWTANLDFKYAKEFGLVSRVIAKKYITNAPNITGVSQEFIKSLIGTKPFNVFRAYDPQVSGSGLKSYTLRKDTADSFNYYSIKNIDTRTITYKDIIAVPAISFKNWREAGSYKTEYEIILKI